MWGVTKKAGECNMYPKVRQRMARKSDVYVCVSVCACVHARARARVCVCVCVCVCIECMIYVMSCFFGFSTWLYACDIF